MSPELSQALESLKEWWSIREPYRFDPTELYDWGSALAESLNDLIRSLAADDPEIADAYDKAVGNDFSEDALLPGIEDVAGKFELGYEHFDPEPEETDD